MDVVCMGELLAEFVATKDKVSLAESPGFLKAPGGAPANVAVGALACTAVGAIPALPTAARVDEFLAERGGRGRRVQSGWRRDPIDPPASVVIARTTDVSCRLTRGGSVSDNPFTWPDSYRGAVSLTFDDARLTQIDRGMAEFDARGVRCTFYVSLHNVEQRVKEWRSAVARGHEIGNHTLHHPCSANYDFSRASRACTEDYTLGEMSRELADADGRIEEMLGVRPRTFAYPCGETHVGRGNEAASYVPLVAERYLAGRGYQHDHPNDPRYCDLAHLLSYRFDVQPAEQHIASLEYAREHGAWVILSGHETGGADDEMLNVSIPRLRAVLDYLGDSGGDLWVAPIAEIARWIADQRGYERPRCDDGRAVVE